MRKNLKPILLLAILLIFLAACEKDENDNTEQPYKVAMLAEGNTFDDMSFLQNCKEGLEKAKDEYLLDVKYNIDTSTDQYQQRINTYGEQKFDLIIAIGFMWEDAVVNAAKTYLASKFILVDTELSETLDNAIYNVITFFVEGSFPGGEVYKGNLANNGVALAPFQDFEDQIPDSIKTEIENIKEGIINGSISTGWNGK